jgi:hypothetical protein
MALLISAEQKGEGGYEANNRNNIGGNKKESYTGCNIWGRQECSFGGGKITV